MTALKSMLKKFKLNDQSLIYYYLSSLLIHNDHQLDYLTQDISGVFTKEKKEFLRVISLYYDETSHFNTPRYNEFVKKINIEVTKCIDYEVHGSLYYVLKKK